MYSLINELSFLTFDFLNIQRSSFLKLLERGVIDEFQKKNPILVRKKKIKIIFFPKFYQLTVPKWSSNQAILKAKTYASLLYIPIQGNNEFLTYSILIIS